MLCKSKTFWMFPVVCAPSAYPSWSADGTTTNRTCSNATPRELISRGKPPPWAKTLSTERPSWRSDTARTWNSTTPFTPRSWLWKRASRDKWQRTTSKLAFATPMASGDSTRPMSRTTSPTSPNFLNFAIGCKTISFSIWRNKQFVRVEITLFHFVQL